MLCFALPADQGQLCWALFDSLRPEAEVPRPLAQVAGSGEKLWMPGSFRQQI